MTVMPLIVRRGTSCRVRLLALLNVVASCFFVLMTLVTTVLSFFIIVPYIHQESDNWIFAQRAVIAYLFINVSGNYLLCIVIDTSSARDQKNQPRSGPTSGATSHSEMKLSIGLSSLFGRWFKSRMTFAPKSGSSFVSDCTTVHTDHVTRSLVSDTEVVVKGYLSLKDHCSESELDNERREKSHMHGSKNQLSFLSPSTSTALATSHGGKQIMPAGSPSLSRKKNLPERSHECKLCERVILKRDHHCYFMTVCIGYFNQKYFIFFCFYMMLGAVYSVVLNVKFLHMRYGVQFNGPQTFFTLLVTVLDSIVYRGLTPSPFYALLLIDLYVCLSMGLLTAGLFYWQVSISLTGQTTHEAMRCEEKYRLPRATDNLRDVLGCYWPLLLFLPLPLPQGGTGLYHAPGVKSVLVRKKQIVRQTGLHAKEHLNVICPQDGSATDGRPALLGGQGGENCDAKTKTQAGLVGHMSRKTKQRRVRKKKL